MATTWFVLIAALWTGYFVLEGFDFGVGMLLPLLGRDDRERRVIINTIGPVWDGNEVWAITAVGATFAAFPTWYGDLLSGLYLPMLAILAVLIIRGVAFEYRGKRDDPAWKARWDAAITGGGLLPALLWGAVFAAMVHGTPLTVATPYALLGGLTTLGLFATHGAVFLALKTTGPIRDRAGALAVQCGVVALVLTAAFLTWTLSMRTTPTSVALAVTAVLALAGALAAARVRREGWAFTATAATIALTMATLFTTLHPYLLPSTVDSEGGLTIAGAAASPYTLKVLTWAAVLVAPMVLAYQGWTYWVFRRRIGNAHEPIQKHSGVRDIPS